MLELIIGVNFAELLVEERKESARRFWNDQQQLQPSCGHNELRRRPRGAEEFVGPLTHRN